MVPVWDRPRPGVVAAPVAEALGATAALVGCAMVPSAGRSISSGCVLGAGVAPGARLGVALDDGRWALVEVKLGSAQIDEAAANLRKLADRVDSRTLGEPSFLMVLTGTATAYQRDDGVLVVPLSCLSP